MKDHALVISALTHEMTMDFSAGPRHAGNAIEVAIRELQGSGFMPQCLLFAGKKTLGNSAAATEPMLRAPIWGGSKRRNQ